MMPKKISFLYIRRKNEWMKKKNQNLRKSENHKWEKKKRSSKQWAYKIVVCHRASCRLKKEPIIKSWLRFLPLHKAIPLNLSRRSPNSFLVRLETVERAGRLKAKHNFSVSVSVSFSTFLSKNRPKEKKMVQKGSNSRNSRSTTAASSYDPSTPSNEYFSLCPRPSVL